MPDVEEGSEQFAIGNRQLAGVTMKETMANAVIVLAMFYRQEPRGSVCQRSPSSRLCRQVCSRESCRPSVQQRRRHPGKAGQVLEDEIDLSRWRQGAVRVTSGQNIVQTGVMAKPGGNGNDSRRLLGATSIP